MCDYNISSKTSKKIFRKIDSDESIHSISLETDYKELLKERDLLIKDLQTDMNILKTKLETQQNAYDKLSQSISVYNLYLC